MCEHTGGSTSVGWHVRAEKRIGVLFFKHFLHSNVRMQGSGGGGVVTMANYNFCVPLGESVVLGEVRV